MNRSTIPYSIVEERRRLNKCIENAPNEWEREIYKKIRDMKIPYDKLDTILETSKELIKKKEKQRKKRMLFLINVSGFAAGICVFIFFCGKRAVYKLRDMDLFSIKKKNGFLSSYKKLSNIFGHCGCCSIHVVFP